MSSHRDPDYNSMDDIDQLSSNTDCVNLDSDDTEHLVTTDSDDGGSTAQSELTVASASSIEAPSTHQPMETSTRSSATSIHYDRSPPILQPQRNHRSKDWSAPTAHNTPICTGSCPTNCKHSKWLQYGALWWLWWFKCSGIFTKATPSW